MPAELEAPATPAAPPPAAAPAAPPAEPALNLDTAFSDAAAAQRTTPPAEPPAPQAPAAETPVSPAASPASPAAPHTPPAAISPSLLTRAQAANLPLEGITTDADLAAALFDHLQQVSPYVQLGQQQLAQHPAQPAAPGPPAAEPEWTLDNYFAQKWQVPEWKPEYQFAVEKGMVKADENGNIVPTPGFEAMVLPLIGGMNAALAARQEQQAKLFSEGNPLKNIYDAIEEPLVRKFEELLEQRFSGYQQTQQRTSIVEKFEADNSAWLYSAPGQLSPQGQQFTAAVSQLRQSGVNDPQKLIDWGLKIAGVNPQANSAPPPAAPAQPATPAALAAGERPRDPATGQFLPAAATPPTPAAPAAPPAPSKQESFLDSARKRAGHSPSRQGHSSSPDDPVSFEQGDLDNYFTQAYRQAAGAN